MLFLHLKKIELVFTCLSHSNLCNKHTCCRYFFTFVVFNFIWEKTILWNFETVVWEHNKYKCLSYILLYSQILAFTNCILISTKAFLFILLMIIILVVFMIMLLSPEYIWFCMTFNFILWNIINCYLIFIFYLYDIAW